MLGAGAAARSGHCVVAARGIAAGRGSQGQGSGAPRTDPCVELRPGGAKIRVRFLHKDREPIKLTGLDLLGGEAAAAAVDLQILGMILVRS